MHSVGKLALSYELKVHVDGARIFNAAVALGVYARDLVSKADSVSFCLSKGLAAPVGSLVCGTRPFIEKARRARKVLGGGMRQAGILAAAGIIALTEMVERLADDHANAKRLAEGLAGINGVSIDPELVRTNIVFFNITRDDITAEQLTSQLASKGIKVLPLGLNQLRAVTHYHITPDDIEYALNVFAKVME
jgi:threonine aldolase